MIRVNQNTIQNIILTLTENKVGPSDYYLLECTNQTTNDIAYCILYNDLSQYKERYNEFELLVSSTYEDGKEQNINLIYSGFYNYVVYETNMNESDFNNLSSAQQAIQFIINELENGLVWLIPSVVNNPKYNPDDSTTYVYQPE